MKWTIHRTTVTAQTAGQRLDNFLAAELVDFSRTFAKKIIDLGGVHLNGRRVRSCSQTVKNHDRLEVYIDQLSTNPYRISEIDVVFRDQYLIILNKPANVDTQPTHARYKGTIYEALQWHLKDPFRPQQKPDLGMIQRLDRGTSGLIMFSIHPQAHKKMTQIFLDRQIEKRYLALVSGIPDPATAEIRSLLARSRKENRVKSVEKRGKEAITRFQTVESMQNCTLLDIELLTGRSHQIRAHMSEQGYPLLGDSRYGGVVQLHDLKLDRPLLHAAQLVFNHPMSGETLRFSAPLPEDFNNVMTVLKK